MHKFAAAFLSKAYLMKTVILLRDLYSEAFRNLGSFLIKTYYKAFAWFGFILFLVVLYAFIFRIAGGFAFN